MSKMSKRQTDCIHFNSTQFEFPTHLSGYVRVDPTCCPMDSLITRCISKMFYPPPRLINNKYYASQKRIVFLQRSSLFVVPARVSSRAIFVPFGFSQRALSLL